jgi:hypothetical protein
MKRLTLEQILALYPEALIFNMLDIRLRKDRHEALKDLAGAYILFCHLQILRRPAAATLQLQVGLLKWQAVFAWFAQGGASVFPG